MKNNYVLFKKIWKHLFSFIEESNLNQEEKHRLQYYSIFLMLAIPTMLVFGIVNTLSRAYLLSFLIFLSAAGMTGGWIYLRIVKKGLNIYRINLVLFELLLLYMVVTGGEAGSKIFWMFTFPLIAFFMIGKIEGIIWNFSIFLMALVLLWVPLQWLNVYQYNTQVKIRFTVTYLIITMISYSFEYLRTQYRIGMESQHQKLLEEQIRLQNEIKQRTEAEQEKERLISKLQETLDVVKKMSGLIPICSSCHKIRDDRGFWNQLEAYIQENSEAQFSHGICPDCAEKLYREMGIPKKKK